MSKKCLYCYKDLSKDSGPDFHERCSLEFFGTKKPPVFAYSLDQMAELAKNVIERSIAVPGVQPKLSLSIVKESLDIGGQGRLTAVGALGGNYIFKPPIEKYPEMPQNEHLTMRIAENFGIRTVKSSLIRLESGELSYITKRIDRSGNGEKIHMLDMFQILEAFDKYRGSMEKVGKILESYSANTLLDQLSFFELGVFSFLTGNNDMHLKNFSMINQGETWLLSPVYDLLNVTIINPEDKEEIALTIEGKKSKLTRQNFENLGRGFGLNEKQIKGVFTRFLRNKPKALQWISNSFLSEDYKEKYIYLLQKRYSKLDQN